MAYTQIYYHIVFATQNRRPVLRAADREAFFKYVWGLLENKRCKLYRINAVEDHVHLFCALHPTLALADLIKDIKVGSAVWIKGSGVFPGFDHWQESYSAFTHSQADKKVIIEYIKGQEEHHRKVSFHEELKKLLEEAGIEFDERFFE